MNENILKIASKNFLKFESPPGSGEYIHFNSDDDISNDNRLQVALTLHEDTWKQIMDWNIEFVKTYFPGGPKAKAIAPLIKEMPYEDERSEIEDDAERYAAWFKRLLDNRSLFLKLPAITQGTVVFRWNNSPRDAHGKQYNGAVTWQSHYGVPYMLIDPIYWFNTDEAGKHNLLIHELEHVMDLYIGESSPNYRLIPASSPGERGDAVATPGQWGDFGSDKQKQQAHYRATFSESNFPAWLKALHSLGETPIPSIKWAGDKREQRSELKKFLGYKNSEMTPEILAELDREKRGVADGSSLSGRSGSNDVWTDYIKDFAKRVGIKMSVLMYMKTDDPSIISHINQIALLDEPVQPSFTEEQSAYACKLDSLHKWLTKQGHSEEAASLDDMLFDI